MLCLDASKVQGGITETSDILVSSGSLSDRVLRRIFYKSGCSPRLHSRLIELRPDVVHAHFALEAIRIQWACQQAGVPLIVTLHGFDITAAPRRPGWRGAVYKIRLRRMFARAARVLAVSEFIRKQALEFGYPPSKVFVHHIGVHIPEQRQIQRAVNRIVAVGRLVEKKGFADLIEAASGLRDNLRPEIIIYGEGPLRASLATLADTLGVLVEFAGNVPQIEVYGALESASLCCVPSRVASNGDQEGLPSVLAEAAARACPIVAYDHSGISENVQDGVTGLLVPEGDVAGLSNALARVLSDVELGQSLGPQARRRAISAFDVLSQAEQLSDHYLACSGAPKNSTRRPDRLGTDRVQ